MNTIHIIGRITNMESRFTKDGKAVLNFGIADNKTAKRTGVKQYYNCVLFGKGAETLGNYAGKGTTIAVTGRCEWQQYEKDGETRNTLKVIVSDFELCGGKKEEQNPTGNDPFPKSSGTDEEIDF